MDTFLGHSGVFWAGVEAICVGIYTVFVIATLWLIYLQIRIALRSFRFDANRRLQELVDEFRDDRKKLFETLPLEIALSHQQFSSKPPGRWRASAIQESEFEQMKLTPIQETALKSLQPEDYDCACHIIARLNDIGQLVEDGMVDHKVLLGKYHVMIIQCCHMVEAIRRSEEQSRGGNYGQRLLRMRNWATTYNDIMPKHRSVPVHIKNKTERRIVYESPSANFAQKSILAVRRRFGLY